MNDYFAKLVHEIIDFGKLTEVDIARRTGSSQPTVHRIKAGETPDPKYSLGTKIIALHAEIKKNKVEVATIKQRRSTDKKRRAEDKKNKCTF